MVQGPMSAGSYKSFEELRRHEKSPKVLREAESPGGLFAAMRNMPVTDKDYMLHRLNNSPIMRRSGEMLAGGLRGIFQEPSKLLRTMGRSNDPNKVGLTMGALGSILPGGAPISSIGRILRRLGRQK